MIKAISPVAYLLNPVRTYPSILTGKLLPVLHQASLHEGVRESRTIIHVHWISILDGDEESTRRHGCWNRRKKSGGRIRAWGCVDPMEFMDVAENRNTLTVLRTEPQFPSRLAREVAKIQKIGRKVLNSWISINLIFSFSKLTAKHCKILNVLSLVYFDCTFTIQLYRTLDKVKHNKNIKIYHFSSLW